jgi:hypothetical protein
LPPAPPHGAEIDVLKLGLGGVSAARCPRASARRDRTGPWTLAAPICPRTARSPPSGGGRLGGGGCLSMSDSLRAASRSLSVLPARAQGTHARAHLHELTRCRHGAGGGGGGRDEGEGPFHVARGLPHACCCPSAAPPLTMLSAARCLVHIFCCMSSATCCLLQLVWCLLSFARCTLSAARRLLLWWLLHEQRCLLRWFLLHVVSYSCLMHVVFCFFVCCTLSVVAVCCTLSAARCLLHVVSYILFAARCPLHVASYHSWPRPVACRSDHGPGGVLRGRLRFRHGVAPARRGRSPSSPGRGTSSSDRSSRARRNCIRRLRSLLRYRLRL